MSPAKRATRKPKLPRELESSFQKRIIDIAHFAGWRVAHFRPAQTSRGAWITPVAADGKGFPDLVLVHEKKGRVVFWECKREGEKASDEQDEWLYALKVAASVAGGAMRVGLVYPCDWDYIVETLTAPAAGEE